MTLERSRSRPYPSISSHADGETLRAALRYAAHGWPVLPVEARGKRPLTVRGVKDATTDPHIITGWLADWPYCNIAIATGSPGPTVLDVDDLEAARDVLAALPDDAPTVATARGRHIYFRGEPYATRRLAFGELRARGSYVIAPPSIHATGKAYVWLLEPTSRQLPAVPASIAARASSTGCGDHRPPVGLVPHGQRHLYLRAFAVHLVRGGVVDERHLRVHLQAEFDAFCEPLPPPAPGALAALAAWAAGSDIAARERRSQLTGRDAFALVAAIHGRAAAAARFARHERKA